MQARVVIALFAVTVLLTGCGGVNHPSASRSISLQPIATGFSSPLDLEQPPDNSGRLFVVEQGGLIKILQSGTVLPQPFLDLRSKIVPNFAGTEMGLLGVPFHPAFQQNRKFYVNYVRLNAGQIQSVISEFQASTANPNAADPASERILLVVNQVSNFPNHKAGQLAFGTDRSCILAWEMAAARAIPLVMARTRTSFLAR